MAVQDATDVLRKAGRAFEDWRHTSVDERAALLERWAALIDVHGERLASLLVLEVGKPIGEARAEVRYASQFARVAAREIEQLKGSILPGAPGVHREVSMRPVGPVLGIAPWNLPLALALRTVAPALAAGCTAVLKPAEQTPFAAAFAAELWREAGGPDATFSLLTCERPAELVTACMATGIARKLTFTGSHATGVALYEQAARQMMRVSMELGGNAPFIVFDDADPEAAVREILRSKFRINGQNCTSVNRVFVQRSIADRLKELLSVAVRSLVVGDPREPATQVGPVVNEAGRRKAAAHLGDAEAKGATVICGGVDESLYVQPALVWGATEKMSVFTEETFAPVLAVTEFDTEDEVVRRANDVPVGLAGYVSTADMARGRRVAERLECGIVGVNNGAPTGDATIPFGGVKQSGLGRSGGAWGLLEHLEPQFRHFQL